MPPTRVKPYVKWGKKNDEVDAAACCEGVTRPSMQFVPIKTVEQQGALMMHRARQLLVEQRTRLGNAIRGHPGLRRGRLWPSWGSSRRAASGVWRRSLRWSPIPRMRTCRR